MRRRSASSIRSSGRRRVESARPQRYVERSFSACSGMSRPRTAPNRSRLERAQSSPGSARTVERRETPGGPRDQAPGNVQEQDHRIERASEEDTTDRTPRRGANIEELKNGDEVEELTLVKDGEQGTCYKTAIVGACSFLIRDGTDFSNLRDRRVQL